MDFHVSKAAQALGDYVVSLREAAIILGCHPDTVKNQARKGKITLLRLSARRLGVRASELKRYMREGEREAA